MKRKIFQAKIDGKIVDLIKCPKLDNHFVEAYFCRQVFDKECVYLDLKKSDSKHVECTLIRKDSLIKKLENGSKNLIPINDEDIRNKLQSEFKTKEIPINEKKKKEKNNKIVKEKLEEKIELKHNPTIAHKILIEEHVYKDNTDDLDEKINNILSNKENKLLIAIQEKKRKVPKILRETD